MKGARVTHSVKGRSAPTCMVRYRCNTCVKEIVLDAYDGAPICRNGHAVEYLEALTIVRSTPPWPTTR